MYNTSEKSSLKISGVARIHWLLSS